jgi:hypothetical protein
MAGAALLGRLTWEVANVVELVEETPRATSIVLELPSWPGLVAGGWGIVPFSVDRSSPRRGG